MRAPFGVVCLPSLASALPAVAQNAKPDLIVVLLDDARAGDIERAMPKTQALLPDGTWFPNFILTTPLCSPSRATLLTGLYAHNHHVYDNSPGGDPGGWPAFVPQEDRTLATALKRAGYRTALVGKYLNAYDPAAGPAPGWDVWDATGGAGGYVGGEPPRYLPDVRAERAAAVAGAVGSDEPLFLWYAELAPHDDDDAASPPQVAARHRDAFPEVSNAHERARLQSILAVDDGVAAIAAALGATRWDQACAVVVSDNGFLLGEHDVTGKGVPFDAAVRVPMLMRCPGIPPGEDARLVGNIDLAPTLARVAGVSLGWTADGYALQSPWVRERLLIQNWATTRGKMAFSGVRALNETYVEYPDGTAALWDRRLDDEDVDRLARADAAQWHAWLEALRVCAGLDCRAAENS